MKYHNPCKSLQALFCLLVLGFLVGCSTYFSTLQPKGSNEKVIYQISEKEAFKLAFQAMATNLPNTPITDITDSVRGYRALLGFGGGFDTYTQQVLVFPASGIDENGVERKGFYFEVSGSGSAIVTGRQKNKKIFKTLNKSLIDSKSGILVKDVRMVEYGGDSKVTENLDGDSIEKLALSPPPKISKITGKRKSAKEATTPQGNVTKEKLAVMDLKAKYGVEQELAEGLSVVIRDAIQGLGDYEVVSKDDVEVVAIRTAIRQSLGCDDTKCLIAVGRSLGTKFMVAGAISKFGDTYNISLRLIDTVGENAGVKERVNRNCKCAEDELIEAAKVTASLLLE